MRCLVLVGADPLGDFPDRKLALDAMEQAEFVVSLDSLLSASSARADVVLPVASVHEWPGTTTNIEGRVMRLAQKLVAPGQSWPDWMVAAEMPAPAASCLTPASQASKLPPQGASAQAAAGLAASASQSRTQCVGRTDDIRVLAMPAAMNGAITSAI